MAKLAEQSVFKRKGEFDVGYNNTDKNYSTVVSLKDLRSIACYIWRILRGPTDG